MYLRSLFGPECDLKKVFFLTHPPLLHPEKTQYLPKDNNGWVGHYKYFLPIQLKEARILEFLLPESEEEGHIKPIKHQIWMNSGICAETYQTAI